jgi:hypothetical protein
MKTLNMLIFFVLLTSCNPDDFIDALLKVPEIQVRSAQITVNHSEGKICVSGIIRNIGGKDVHGPFKVAVGITRYTNIALNHFIFSEEIIEVPANVTIPANGGEYVTEPCSIRELVYRDKDPNALYEFDILADIENVLPEFDDWGNNRFTTKWWTVSPGLATPFKIILDNSRPQDPSEK